MERYVAIQPDAFDRILTMAEQQQAANIAALHQAQRYQHRDTERGQWLGALTTFAAMAGAAYCGVAGSTAVAIALVAIPVMSVAKALIDSGTVRRHMAAQGDTQDESD